MHITYLIGNGFDLSCGLETRYTNVYDKYCYTLSPNDNISEFKKTILKNNYENWTDFEMALPGFGKKLNDFEKFSECILDFTAFLEDYLKEQESMIDINQNKNTLASKIRDYIYHVDRYCLQASEAALGSMIQRGNEHTICNFVTFNYTDTLEKCLSTVSKSIAKNSQYLYQYNNPIHVHGVLYNGILLGLDNEKFYKDIPCDDARKLRNLIDKVYINSRYSNITNQILKIIKESNIIVIFGWSMGESDSFWGENVKKIFSGKPDMHLVYVPYYSTAVNKRFRNQSLNREDEQKDFIMKKFDLSENQRGRVHIVTDTEYMKLDFLAKGNNKLITA